VLKSTHNYQKPNIAEHLFFCFSVFNFYSQTNWLIILRVQYSSPVNMSQSYSHRTCQFTYKLHFYCHKEYNRNYILGKIFKSSTPLSCPLGVYRRSPVTGPVCPRGFQDSRRFRLPDSHDIQHINLVRLSSSRTGYLNPRKCSWYSFSLGTGSTPGPWYCRKKYVTEKSIH